MLKRTHFGANGYIEYIKGNIPVVLTAPHGGQLRPSDIPDRTRGFLEGDTNTLDLISEITRGIVQFCSRSDRVSVPHVIICHLDRSKIDANRDLVDAVCSEKAEPAWYSYHNFIEIAKHSALTRFGCCHYFDIHGNTASTKVMIGQMIRKKDFDGFKNKEELLSKFEYQSTIRSLSLSKKTLETKWDLILGTKSLGFLLGNKGIQCTPVGQPPFDWGGEEFYNGGYNTIRHSSYRHSNLLVNGTQIETPIELRRKTLSMEIFGKQFAAGLTEFFTEHYQVNLCQLPAYKVD
jgi:hypothetical protein